LTRSSAVDTLRVVRHCSGLWLVLLILLPAVALSCLSARVAHANDMALTLARLSRGDCARTLSSADDFALRENGAAVLAPDRALYAALVSQLSGALAPPVLAPVTTRGPTGFDISLATGITEIDQHLEAWQRGTQGKRAAASCEGRNRDVQAVLPGNQLRFVKGLPFGISIGASAGFLHGLGLWTFGSELKIAIIEGSLKPWVPSLALRLASNSLVGDGSLALSSFAFDAIASREFAAAHVMQVVPYLALGAVLSRAASTPVDLTPNIDANACAAGRDPTCNAHGLGASRDDLAHERSFPKLLLMRYRAVLGVWLRYRLLAVAAEASIDLLRPDRADADVPSNTPRQWGLQLAPSLSF
jgi:hypothetical protein